MSTLLTIIVLLLVIGVCLYLLDRYVIPVIPAPWGRIIEAVIVIVIVLYCSTGSLGRCEGKLTFHILPRLLGDNNHRIIGSEKPGYQPGLLFCGGLFVLLLYLLPHHVFDHRRYAQPAIVQVVIDQGRDPDRAALVDRAGPDLGTACAWCACLFDSHAHTSSLLSSARLRCSCLRLALHSGEQHTAFGTRGRNDRPQTAQGLDENETSVPGAMVQPLSGVTSIASGRPRAARAVWFFGS
jgi:hypothetical protein